MPQRHLLRVVQLFSVHSFTLSCSHLAEITFLLKPVRHGHLITTTPQQLPSPFFSMAVDSKAKETGEVEQEKARERHGSPEFWQNPISYIL